MSFIKESEIVKKPNKMMKFLIGPWNTGSHFELAVGNLEQGQKSSYYFHEKIEEALYIISGTLEINIEGHITEMNSGTAVYIKPGLKHRLNMIIAAIINV